MFPRGADTVAPAWLVVVPVGRQGSEPAHGVLPLTSTIRPRMDGSVLPARYSDCPDASAIWPPGAVRAPPLVTFCAASRMRPPFGSVAFIRAPGWTEICTGWGLP